MVKCSAYAVAESMGWRSVLGNAVAGAASEQDRPDANPAWRMTDLALDTATESQSCKSSPALLDQPAVIPDRRDGPNLL